MSPALDMDQIAKHLKAERRGKVVSGGGYFGALQLAKEIADRTQEPDAGNEELLVRLSAKTHEQLEKLAQKSHARRDIVAALLLEQAVEAAVVGVN